MRILILAQEISLDQPGGSGRVAWEQARALAARGHTIALGVPHGRASLKDEERRENVTIFRFGDVKRRLQLGKSIADIMDTPRFMKQMMAGARWDLLIAHHPHVAYGALRVPAVRHVPLIYIFHASAAAEIQYEGLSRPGLWPLAALFLKPGFVSWTRWIETRVLRHARTVGVFSDFSGKLLRTLYPRATRKTAIVRMPMGIDATRFHLPHSKRAVRQELQLPADALIAVTVRRLVPRTGVKILIDAWRALYDRVGAMAHLVIVGEGRERQQLETHARAIGLADLVHFAGHVRDAELPAWYQAADVTVIPTVAYEGFGVSIVESMACGTPVIGTPVGAIPEILLAFDERLLADAARPLPIAERLVWFAEEGMREEWASLTRDFVKRWYSWEKHAEKIEELVQKHENYSG